MKVIVTGDFCFMLHIDCNRILWNGIIFNGVNLSMHNCSTNQIAIITFPCRAVASARAAQTMPSFTHAGIRARKKRYLTCAA